MKRSWIVCLLGLAIGAGPTAAQDYVPLPPGLEMWPDNCNVYVFREGNEALLVDIGSGKVLDHLDGRGVKVVKVVMTDFPRDRSAGATRLKERGIPLVVPERLEKLFTEVEPWWGHPGNPAIFFSRMRMRSSVPVDATLKEGDEFQFGTWSFRVLDTPGSSDGAISLIARRDNTTIALCGDLMVAPGRLRQHYGIGAPSKYAFGPDSQVTYLSWMIGSAAKVAATKPSLILPAYGDPVADPQKACKDLRDRLLAVTKLVDVWSREYWSMGWTKQSKPFQEFHFEIPAERPRSDAAPANRGLANRAPRIPAPEPVPAPGKHTELTPHLIWIAHGGMNMYALLSDSGEALAVDSGLGNPGGGFNEKDVELLKERGVKRVALCVPTHYHSDHIGGFYYLTEKQGAEIWAVQPLANAMERPGDFELPWQPQGPLKVSRIPEDGETIAWHEYKLQFHWQPGHTLYAEDMFVEVDGKRVAFCGDNILGAYAGTPGYITPYNRSGTSELAKSVERVIQFKPDLVLGGHTYICDNPREGLRTEADWARKLTAALQDLVALPNARAIFDPYWARLQPFSAAAKPGDTLPLALVVANHYDRPMYVEFTVSAPHGVTFAPEKQGGEVRPGKTSVLQGALKIGPNASPGRHIVAAEMTIGNQPLDRPDAKRAPLGEAAVMVLRIGTEADSAPAAASAPASSPALR